MIQATQQPAPKWFVGLFSVTLLGGGAWLLFALARGAIALLTPSSPTPPTLGPDVPVAAMAAPAEEAAPDLSTLYSVTKDDDLAGLNRKVEITLFKKQKVPTLEAICRKIHASDAHQHEITFLFFDVRGVPKPPKMAHWAIARFEPDLTVTIFGDE